jgi:aconitate hydratase
LGAVGGTINEDDHVFGLAAARKYGGIYVPPHLAVIHQYLREMMTGGGRMILGSDSHTRYGALGSLAIGEGGGELAKQLLRKTYDLAYPEVIAVYLEGRPGQGVGPQDVALAIIGAVFKDGFVKNKIMEFVGPGIASLSVDFRNGIDVMTTETTCLSSIWQTDDLVRKYYALHGRESDYQPTAPGDVAYYDGLVKVDLSKVKPMIALPFHPSNVFSIDELNENPWEILRSVEEEAARQLENPDFKFNLTGKVKNGRLQVDQGIIAGCAGGSYENIVMAANILEGASTGHGAFALSVYPASQPVKMALVRDRSVEKLLQAGVILRTAFCGPCFGAGDVPAHNALSIRHTTRNFPNREGSKPDGGQIASVALMDTRSIAATALNGGRLTAATEIDYSEVVPGYVFDRTPYDHRVYWGFGKAQVREELVFGPNIADWPKIRPLPENLLLKMASIIDDPVTTTDELIPSGETASYRSNPLKLAEFTLSRKDPGYVGRAKAIQAVEYRRQAGEQGQEVAAFFQSAFGKEKSASELAELMKTTGAGSVIFAVKPGDGSAREQAASCQRVLGADANIALEYATRRYRGNLINWGMIPFIVDKADRAKFALNDYLYLPGIRRTLAGDAETITAYVINAQGRTPVTLKLENLTRDERDIITAGCLINYYAQELGITN